MTPTLPEAIAEPARGVSRAALTLAATAGIVVAGTAALWIHYGTAVFTETIIAGINACF